MSAFKDQVSFDIDNVFMNEDEFPNRHLVNGKWMTVIIDNYEQIDREKRYQYKRSQYADGVSLKELLIYVKASEFGSALPRVGGALKFDGKEYKVSDALDEDGIYSISLEANTTKA